MKDSGTAREVSMNIFRAMNLMIIGGYVPIYVLLRRHFRRIMKMVGPRDRDSMRKDLRAIVYMILAYVSASVVTLSLQLLLSESHYTDAWVQCIMISMKFIQTLGIVSSLGSRFVVDINA